MKRSIDVALVGLASVSVLGLVSVCQADSSAIQSSVADVKASLGNHGVKEIVFATRQDGNDGHWYANIGDWSYDKDNMLYGKGGRLCKLNVETGELVTLIDDPQGSWRTVSYGHV